nr:GNAT family N-acetyltransferase [Flexivirga oryzae]
MSVRACTATEFLDTVHQAGRTVPVEQSPEWARYDDVLPGREHWRYLVVDDGDTPLAAISLTSFAGRFLEQLWAKHGPIWLAEDRSPERERAVRDALSAYIRSERPSAAVLRLHTVHPGDDLVDPLIAIFYDRTIVLDLTKDEDQLLAEMSQSGRRNIRKAMKNDELVFTDDTAISEQEFADVIYPIFEETGRRGDFVLRPPAFYYEMLRQLGPDVCRLYTVRHRGTVVSWALVTVYDGEVDYYFAASSAEARKLLAAYLMAWGTMRTTKAEGATYFDFLGCGSDRSPYLDTLNEFKLAFAKKGMIDAPGPWDVVLRPNVLRAYHAQRTALAGVGRAKQTARAIIAGVPRSKSDAVGLADVATSKLAGAVTRAPQPPAAAPNVLPVVLDFTLSGYALARAFHERYGLTSVAVVPFTTGAIADSSIIPHVREVGPDGVHNVDLVLREIRKVATENPELTVIPLTNHDGLVQALSAKRATLGKNVLVPHESPEMLHRVSDKNVFNQLCAAAGVPTPRTVVLDFADGRPSSDVADLPWPLIVKPADSGHYASLRMPGKKKLYQVADQTQLDTLLDQFEAAGYDGQLLAQEFIPGTDLISVTLYRAADGRITLARASQVLMQDPRPAYLGIPDVQVVTPMDDAIALGSKILVEADYHGFANLDGIRDPRDGRVVFFEINPRYGRNCYYATASGANVAEQLVADLIDEKPVVAPDLDGELLYTTLPAKFVEQTLGGEAAKRVRRLAAAGRVVDPLQYAGERNPKHRAYAKLAALHHRKAYRDQPVTLNVEDVR